MKDNRLTTIHFLNLLHTKCILRHYTLVKEAHFFQFNFKNQFSSIIAFKREGGGASLLLVYHVPLALIPSY